MREYCEVPVPTRRNLQDQKAQALYGHPNHVLKLQQLPANTFGPLLSWTGPHVLDHHTDLHNFSQQRVRHQIFLRPEASIMKVMCG